MGPAQARQVLDNLGTKIWCRLADDQTAVLATEGLGTCTVRLPETGVGLNGRGGVVYPTAADNSIVPKTR
jgi:hypothetical protein